jgi:methylmalonyl-CoA/ethylmalonyl-CoA epimerase
VPLTDARPDHVAAAVPDFDAADARWRDRLGGSWASWFHNRRAGFRARQLRFRGDAKLELLQPSEVDPSDDNFVRRVLERFGSRVHHVTLKVPDLAAAIATVTAEGLEVVDVFDTDPVWKEAFVRPSLIGGIIVQLAEAHLSDDDWAAAHGQQPEDPRDDGAVLVGPLLQHDDLDRARAVWTTLGATVTVEGPDRLVASWDGAPLSVTVRRGSGARPVGLLFEGAPPLPDDPVLGPAVLPVRRPGSA